MNKNKLLGLLDVLESAILDGKRIPLTQSIMVNEQESADILDKMRKVINAIEEKEDMPEKEVSGSFSESPKNTLQEAEEEALKVKGGATKYAHYILSNLQLTVTKMQNNLVKLEKNIESGRNMIEEKTGPMEEDKSKNKEIYNEFTL
ncbi:hypothetical protein OAJ27_01300 [bacterium]|nr:hypothetical protein [bacterium]